MKKTIFCLAVVLCIFICCCKTGALEHNVEVQNKTDSEIFVLACSMQNDLSFPLSVGAEQSETFVIQGAAESADFQVEYQGCRYDLNSGYIQDYSTFSIVFDSSDSELKAHVNAGERSFEIQIEKSE
ncbi:MAG: hypothetical protein IJ688_04520 [Treponema sp.]|uniref:hypothetical protein n=1 Tax=Treponema sp. TaxID=166 RepID=UPI0025E5B676|nr:hypothetical protein [Treponema sp.]MBQ8681198.1 hypothetical protein [Treponema sp.]MBR1638633.1 hypothetical protein [Treponema sp.]